jgi:DNA-directed RNA polymerase alpha subunit
LKVVSEFRPLEPGYRLTVMHLERVLLSALEGYAITSMKVMRFSTISGVEDVYRVILFLNKYVSNVMEDIDNDEAVTILFGKSIAAGDFQNSWFPSCSCYCDPTVQNSN